MKIDLFWFQMAIVLSYGGNLFSGMLNVERHKVLKSIKGLMEMFRHLTNTNHTAQNNSFKLICAK